MKKILKALVAIVCAPIALFLILTLLLYCPPIQRWAVSKATDVASEKTGMNISVEELRLSFPLDLRLENLKATKANDSIPQQQDTIANVGSLTAHIQLLPLFQGKVEVDWLTFKQLRMSTENLIGNLRIKADLERLHLQSHGIDLPAETALVNLAEVRGGYIDIALGDTVPKDTAQPKTLWQINIDKLQLSQTDFRLHLPGDTMSVRAQFGNAVAQKAQLQLKDNTYKVAKLDWHGGALQYDQNYQPLAPTGFDAAHISLNKLNLGMDGFSYAGTTLAANIRAANFTERSGLTVNAFQGHFRMDSTCIALQNLRLTMPQTQLQGHFTMDLNAFSDVRPGQIQAQLDGHTSLADLRPFLTSLPKDVLHAIPTSPFTLSGKLNGNLRHANISRLHVAMPDRFDLTASGWVKNLTQPGRMKASLKLKGRTDNLDFLAAMMPKSINDMLRIPRGIGLNGTIGINETRYAANLTVTEGSGRMRVDGTFDTASEDYRVALQASHFELRHFLPKMELGTLTGNINAQGHGTDFFSPRATASVKADIHQFSYANYNLNGINANLLLHGGKLSTNVRSQNPMIGGDFGFSGSIGGKNIDGHFRGHIQHLNLAKLGIKDFPYIVSGYADVDIKSDLASNHYVKGPLTNLRLTSTSGNGSTNLLAGTFDIMANLHGNALTAQLQGHLEHANLHKLGLIDRNYHLRGDADIVLQSNMKSRHSVKGTVNNLSLNERRDSTTIHLLAGNFNVDGGMNGKQIDGHINATVGHADLYQLGVTDQPLTTTLTANLDVSTDQGDLLTARGLVGNLQLRDKSRTYSPGDLTLDLISRRDTTHAHISGGDFSLRADMDGSYKQLADVGTRIATTLRQQMADKVIDQKELLGQLPNGHFFLNSGTDNFFCQLLKQNGYAMRVAQADITSSPSTGLNGYINVDSLVYQNNFTVDTLRMNLKSDGNTLNYDLAVSNSPSNSYPYRGRIDGSFFEKGVITHALIKDKNGKTGFDLGLRAAMENNGVKMDITTPTAILGYKTFQVNDGNYIYLGQNRRMSAHMRLQAADGAGVQLYTNDADTTALQDVTLSMHQFELEKVFAVLPFMPSVSGMLDGDYHIVQTEQDLTISGDMTVKNLIYEHSPMGNVGTQLVYMPQSDGSHYVDAIFLKDDQEVGTLTGTYQNEGDGYLEAQLDMNHFPLNYINGFVPDQLIGLQGTGEGTLSLKGKLNQLDVNGELFLDSTYLVSVPYGVSMRFADDPVTIEHSRVKFENFEMFANNDSPLNVQGYLDFSNMSDMYLDVRMRADNFELIDAKENPRSEAYGKAFINFRGILQGPLSQLRMGGKIDVLGSTDMAYVMRDAQLTSDTELDNLVQFTNFSDSVGDVISRPDITGLNMSLSVSVDEQARIMCYLTSDHSNYIDLIGGGTLHLSYDPTNDLQLRGRYTLSNGEMKYSLPVIPLRTFQIQDGSYIEFTGQPMQPTLNITATERVKTAVASSGSSQGRIVDFDCGVRLSKTFPDMGIEFIINAPEDVQMSNELNMKSDEERSKLAVSMLASGMYLDNNVGNFAMNSALASFLQTEVNKITGSAFRSMGLDLTANMESTADATGSLHTDYTFKFSKRVLNNRLRISMGGRVSTGATTAEDNGAYFDNFSLEYRLNQKETQYLKLYYEREAYDWLEGNISEFGAGFSWRRKLLHLKDILKFKTADDASVPVMRVDSTQRKKQ